MPVVLPFRQFIIKGVFIKELSQVNPARDTSLLPLPKCKEETGRIQRIGIEIWKNRIDQFLHVSVQRSTVTRSIGNITWNLGLAGFPFFSRIWKRLKWMASVTPGKSLHYVFRRFPVGGILGVIIITVDRKAIAADKVFSVAIVVLIFRTHIIMPDGFLQGSLVQHDLTMGIGNSYRGSR